MSDHGPRLLQVVADTDDREEQRRALELHERLAALGCEVRTVALAPGRTGELAKVLPVLAPGRRTFAALGALRSESRWADVLVLHGPRALPPLVRWLRGLPPLVLLATDGDVPSSSLLGRLAARGPVAVVVADGAHVEPLPAGVEVVGVEEPSDPERLATQLRPLFEAAARQGAEGTGLRVGLPPYRYPPR